MTASAPSAVRRRRLRNGLSACTVVLATLPALAAAQARPVDGPAPWGAGPLPVPVPVPQLPVPQPPASSCRGENVGRVVGGLLGAAIGRQIAGDDRRTLGTVGGALAGVWLGGTIGRQVDAGQPGCGGRGDAPAAEPLPPVGVPLPGPRSTWAPDTP